MSTHDAHPTLEQLRHHPELSEANLGAILSSLVRIRSVNPGDSERAVAEHIAALLEGTGCALTFVESMPGRPSLAAILPGAAPGPRLVLNGHTDTVPIDDPQLWSVDPFGAEIKDGALWGRGAVDMKGGLAAQIACARVLSTIRDRRGSLVLHFAAGEEKGEPGTRSLIERGFTGDWGITTEPTDLAVATAQRGVAWYRVRINGRSSHASYPQGGRNPIQRLGRVTAAIEEYERRISGREHPLFASPTCSITMVRAGVEQNAIPDYCELILDRRLLPGDSSDGVLEELRDVLGAVGGADADYTYVVEPYLNPFEPAEVPADSPFINLVRERVREVTGAAGDVIGTPYGSDVRNLINDAGMEAITFGAGKIALCHCPDEHLQLSDLRAAALVLAEVAMTLLVL